MKYPYRQKTNNASKEARIIDNLNVIDIASDIGELLSKAGELQSQLDSLVLNAGDSSAAVAQALVDETGKTFSTLKAHLDDKGNKINILSENGIHVESFPIIAPESNDSARFQRAVNKANTSGTRIVVLKNNKTYNITTKITSYDDLTFIGYQSKIAGGGATKFMDAMNRNLFIGINFDGYNFVVQADGKEKVSFERCGFTNIGVAAVYYYGAKNSYVTNCEFNNITKSSIVVDNDGDNILIMNSTFDNPSEFGGYAVEQNDCAHINVSSGTRVFVLNNPKVKNNGGQGILFGYNSSLGKGARYCKAIGNYCEGNGQEGITSFGGSNKVAYQNTIAHNTSKNNRFHQIEIWQSDDNTVIGNTVDESNTYGSMGALTLYNTKGTIASDNKVLNASNNGVAILAGSDRLVVKNTTIKGTNGKNDTSTATKGHGILLDSNGVAQPTNILLKDAIIESTDTSKTSSNNKFGVYSTSNSLQGNTIKDINTTGYANNVHLFAKNTTKHMSSAKPAAVTGYDTYVENVGTLAEAGTTGSKYVVRGWLQVGGVFVDDRMITGN
ncbi:right-handed parallel beta-helix repeat-containing protein [Priestia megaterium]